MMKVWKSVLSMEKNCPKNSHKQHSCKAYRDGAKALVGPMWAMRAPQGLEVPLLNW